MIVTPGTVAYVTTGGESDNPESIYICLYGHYYLWFMFWTMCKSHCLAYLFVITHDSGMYEL